MALEIQRTYRKHTPLELTNAVLAFNGIATRNFNTFPGEAWGRSVKWLDAETRQPIALKVAREQFSAGRKVLYTSKGYTAYVIFDVNGRTPNKAK